mgnify:CR=1 FL=1|tara:strand:- start:43 stop:501 length:459 start_codon:yes stop_codon:yes gene_type:complete
MAKTKKEKWIEQERKRLLEQHYDNLRVIEDKQGIIKHCLHRIGLLHRSVSTLAGQYSWFNGAIDFDEDQENLIADCLGEVGDRYRPQHAIACQLKYGIEILEKEQESYAIKVAQARKDIDAIGSDAAGSYQIYEKASTDEVLSKRYDKEVSK